MNSRDKINILFVTDCMADLMGGAERQIYELAKALDKDKFDVTIASLECVGKAPRHLIEEIGCHFIDFPVRRIYGLSGLIQGIRFWKFLKQEKIHILQTYHFSSDIWGTLWGHFAGVKHIVSNRRDMGFWRTQRHINTYKLINRWVNKIVVVAQSIKKLVIDEENVSEEKIQVIHNGIHAFSGSNEISTEQIRQEIGVAKEDIVIMHVANLTPVKGHKYLINSLSHIVKKYQNVKLVLVGEGELREYIEDQINEMGLADHVLLLGKREDTRRLLYAADICVLSSVSEGMSNAILEYMEAGKPVVATHVGGNPELVLEGQTGFLVDQENSDQISERLLQLIKDERMRQTFGLNGQKRIKEKFSMDSMITTYRDLYAKANDKHIKVCHLVSSSGLFGAERVILNIAKNDPDCSTIGVVRNNHNVHLEIIEEAKKMDLKTVVFESRGKFDLNTIAQLRKFLKQNKIDILHSHNYKSDIIGFCATRLIQAKWMATNHVWHGSNRKVRFYEAADALVLKYASRVIAVSDEIKNELLKKNFKERQVRVIDNGIDLSLFNSNGKTNLLRNELAIPRNNVVVTIVGRLSKEKGHTVFINAAKEVLKKKNNVTFLIVGDGPLKEELHANTEREGLNDNVIFTGIRKDMPDIYSISDIFVNTSSIEGLPMTILEAMASKLALIVTPVGAVPKVIRHNINGLIVDEGDHKSLSNEICALIDQPKIRQSLVNQAYEDVCKDFSFEIMASRYRNIYNEILNLKGNSRC